MRKIAIFGGTFNPIHNGHINLCLECQKVYDFDKIIFVPTNLPPHKVLTDLASNEDRYEMIKLAISCVDSFEVSDIEFKLGEKSYTINTVNALKRIYPNDKLYLIIGSDMFEMFSEWYRYEDILRSVTLVVGARHYGEFEHLNCIKDSFLQLSCNIEIINANVFDTSSTLVRNMIKNDESINGLVDDKVLSYIKSHNVF